MRTAFVVLGMHRSGTSSIAGTLAILGATPPRTLMGPKPDNPKGFWESEVLMMFNDEILTRAQSAWNDPNPLDASIFTGEEGADLRRRAAEKIKEEFSNSDTIVLKDPRICRFFPFWKEVLQQESFEICAFIPVRSPLEVATSLQARNGMPLQQGLDLWRRHVIDAERDTRATSRQIVSLDDFLADWRSVVGRLDNKFLMTLDMSNSARVDTFLQSDTKTRFSPECGNVELQEFNDMYSKILSLKD